MDDRLRWKEEWWQMFRPRISPADKVLTADLDSDRGATAEGDAAVRRGPADIGSGVSSRTHAPGREVK